MGHIAQAHEAGAFYLQYYISTAVVLTPGIWLAANVTGHNVSVHDAIPLERDANLRRGLGDPWFH